MISDPSQLVLFSATVIAIVGALIGSFSNVVIWRLPRGESVVWPGSACPNCKRRLTPLELIPVVSWLVQRARCRGCGKPISARYPLVELIMAAGFFAIAMVWPVTEHGLTFLPLLVLYALLVILAFIDIDTYTLPDSLTLPAFFLALTGTFLYSPGSGLPTLQEAFMGGMIGAGALTLINRLGGLALRRLKDTRERLWPLGFDQVNLAAVLGLLFGWQSGALAALASLLLNLVSRRIWRLPEGVLYLVWLVGLLVLVPYVLPITLPAALEGTLVAAGIAAMAGALWWWIHGLLTRGKETGAPAEPDPAADEPIAMGFGDAKLAAVLGAMLGWESFLVALLVAIVLGAVVGVAGRALGGERQIPFGPYLVAGAVVALFYGSALVTWYTGLLGI